MPEAFVISSEGVIMDPSVLQFAATLQRVRGKAGRAKTHVYSEDHGRYVKVIIPKQGTRHRSKRSLTIEPADVSFVLCNLDDALFD